jgi:hypothetical protein
MAQDEEGGLARLSPEEERLVRNYRVVNAIRQDTLLYFSDELVKLEAEDLAKSSNVFHMSGRKADASGEDD